MGLCFLTADYTDIHGCSGLPASGVVLLEDWAELFGAELLGGVPIDKLRVFASLRGTHLAYNNYSALNYSAKLLTGIAAVKRSRFPALRAGA